MALLTINENGLYCKQGDFYIDPWRPVKVALITHGHSDHMRWGMKHYICHQHTVPILRLRLGIEQSVQGVEYGEPFEINGVSVSFHPAGHIIGSSQIRLSYRGEVWVFTGDYKMEPDGVSAPFESLLCDHFISECTFGLPVYRFPRATVLYQAINDWWKSNAQQGYNTVLYGYSLGKAQNILAHLDKSIGDIYLHGAVANVNEALEEVGFHFPGVRMTTDMDRQSMEGAVIVAPPSANNTPWVKKLKPYREGMCSGWMQLRGSRRRRSVDKGFALSDHCDWNQLNIAVEQSGASHVYLTHGYEVNFARWLAERYQVEAAVLKTLYNDEMEEEG
ncbi:ligase-associated DNA damage response exonuclease [Sphingobacterium faecale]|uniref:Ligase-associated DNA damage response exonuclease n=1 Tax=Sphingobacterium faecale TaxID=2803775 RepID=A0ABS1R301_9SPHI|nr:ligase-associated DNA damage response exonuclease [Sphingobacterium faecale]MBL1409038.1 ligase-associated DNA damage response exonuclease [Sphingobacterium faecale]